MKSIPLILLAFMSVTINAQGFGEDPEDIKIENERKTINAEKLKLIFSKETENNYEYCQIVGTAKFLSKKITIEMDFGQEAMLFDDMRLKDENGKPKVFNSMIDALNYMGLFGWKFAQAYVVTIQDQNVYHFLIKRKKNK